MNPLFREYKIAWYRLRLLYWQWAAQSAGPAHTDTPAMVLMQMHLRAHIGYLESRRVRQS
jgi:hypothetical protein